MKRYLLNFGSGNAGLPVSWTAFLDNDTLQPIVPQPAIVEDGYGVWHFEFDSSVAPVGTNYFRYVATCNGLDCFGVEPVVNASFTIAALSTSPAPWTTDALVAAVKRRASVPTAQGAWQVTDFLTAADEEIRSFILPLVRRVHEEYYLQTYDYTLTAGANQSANAFGTLYPIPSRAVAGTLRDALLLDANGNPIEIPRISVDDLEQASWGLYVLGNQIGYVNKTTYATPVAMRMIYYLRPNTLVPVANAATVTGVAGNLVSLSGVPAGFAGNTAWDLIRGVPGFDMLGFDLAGEISGTTLVITDPAPTNIQLGDFVCVAGQTPVPQVPAELHPLLAERVAYQYLKINDPEAAQQSKDTLAEMQANALILIGQRMEGEPKKVIPRNSVWRRWRR